ncbi:MAG: hypothetical protein U9Q90_02970 [Campylobacterota bacterium]|nr:hypothetical protein [Campylobacterota bacterium]
MLHKNEERINKVREDAIEVLNDLLTSEKLLLQGLENCDQESYDQAFIPHKKIGKKIEAIDSNIITVLTLYTPEAKDLREMVAFLKITSALKRVVNNLKNYIKNMEICNPHAEEDVKMIIAESLAINRCTINSLEYTIEMVKETEDRDKLRELASKISVEASKTDDIYALVEKEILLKMNSKQMLKEEHFNLLKYIRKNLKVTDRLEDIAARLLFARVGGDFSGHL